MDQNGSLNADASVNTVVSLRSHPLARVLAGRSVLYVSRRCKPMASPPERFASASHASSSPESDHRLSMDVHPPEAQDTDAPAALRQSSPGFPFDFAWLQKCTAPAVTLSEDCPRFLLTVLISSATSGATRPYLKVLLDVTPYQTCRTVPPDTCPRKSNDLMTLSEPKAYRMTGWRFQFYRFLSPARLPFRHSRVAYKQYREFMPPLAERAP